MPEMVCPEVCRKWSAQKYAGNGLPERPNSTVQKYAGILSSPFCAYTPTATVEILADHSGF